MKKGLFSKLMIAFIAIIMVSFVMTAAFLSYWFEGYYFKQRESELLKESQFIKYKAIQYLNGNLTADEINETLTYIGNYLSADIWLVDNYGYVYSVSKSEHKNLIATSKQIVTSDLKELRQNKTVDKTEKYSQIFANPVHTFEILGPNGQFNLMLAQSGNITITKFEDLDKLPELIEKNEGLAYAGIVE